MQVDRSPCGSGVSGRVALQHARGVLAVGQKRTFRSGATGAEFKAGPVRTVELKGYGQGGSDVSGVIAEVSGRGFYTGSNTFTVEAGDPLAGGFLPR